ncbi:hypothetical protein BDV10DRAFT_93181 [Aspergillus recurvatus]
MFVPLYEHWQAQKCLEALPYKDQDSKWRHPLSDGSVHVGYENVLVIHFRTPSHRVLLADRQSGRLEESIVEAKEEHIHCPHMNDSRGVEQSALYETALKLFRQRKYMVIRPLVRWFSLHVRDLMKQGRNPELCYSMVATSEVLSDCAGPEKRPTRRAFVVRNLTAVLSFTSTGAISRARPAGCMKWMLVKELAFAGVEDFKHNITKIIRLSEVGTALP